MTDSKINDNESEIQSDVDEPPTDVRTSRFPGVQFRLRTLFVLITVVGVAAGIWGTRLYREHVAKQAYEFLQAAGAVALKDKAGDVYRVHFTGEKFGDAAMVEMAPHLRVLPKLNQLDLVKVPVTDKGLKHLSRLAQVKDLYVFETQVTDAGTSYLQRALPGLTIKNEKPEPWATSMAGTPIYQHAINAIAMRADGLQFVAGNGAGELRWWDNYRSETKDNRSPSTTTTLAHTEWLFGLAYSPNGQRVATGGGDGLMKIWDARSRQQLAEMDVHRDDVHAVAFAPDGESLYSVSDDMTVRRTWIKPVDVPRNFEGREQRTYRTVVLGRHAATIPSMALDPTGRILASASRDDTIALWDADKGGLIRSLVGHEDDVMSVAFSTSGETIVSGSYDGTVRLWNVATGELLGTLSGHKGRVYSVAISPDGTTIASGGADGLMVWERDSHRATHRSCRQQGVSSLRFTSDTELVAADISGRVRFIDLTTRKSKQSFSTSRAALAVN